MADDAYALALYREGYEHSRRRLGEGLHPDAIRLWWHLLGEHPAPTWWGVEDALAGRVAESGRAG